MNMIIRTRFLDDYYTVNSAGLITSGDPPKFSFSGGWKMLGLIRSYHGKLTQDFISFNSLTPETIKSLQLKYKNGKGMYHIVDLDHGTKRIWGEPVTMLCFDQGG